MYFCSLESPLLVYTIRKLINSIDFRLGCGLRMVILLSCTKSDFSYSENVFENVLGNVSGGERLRRRMAIQ